MKTKSVSLSAYLTPRVLAGFSFGAIGILLALVAFIALPKHSARANLGYCNVPDIYYEYAGSNIAVEMESETQNNLPCIVFYTTDQSTPTHSGDTATGTTSRYYGAILIAPQHTVCFKAIGYRANYSDSGVAADCISNPPQ